MDPLQIFPHLNAGLNALSCVFLLSGFYFIMKIRVREHHFCMLGASSVSALFLVSYIAHHALRTYYFGLDPTKFTGEGVIRPIYFTILITHTILAITIVPMVIITLRNGLKMRVMQHRRIARWTFPLWMYVSVTGVLVYFFLYQWFPST